MKKYILFIIFLIGIKSINAQDVIVLRDASEIESKVLEIDEINVKYKKWDNLDGPTYTIQQDKILFVRYENGTKEVFNPAEMPKDTISESHNNERPFVKKGSFQTYISLGYYTGNRKKYLYYLAKDNYRTSGGYYSGGIDITGSFGVRINDYAYVGIMTGVSFINYKYLTIPIAVDSRVYFPINKNLHPFIEIAQGLEGVPFGCLKKERYNYHESKYLGLNGKGTLIYWGNIGVGVDEKVGSLSLGWYRFAIYNSFYVRIGINPCWNKIKKQ